MALEDVVNRVLSGEELVDADICPVSAGEEMTAV